MEVVCIRVWGRVLRELGVSERVFVGCASHDVVERFFSCDVR